MRPRSAPRKSAMNLKIAQGNRTLTRTDTIASAMRARRSFEQAPYCQDAASMRNTDTASDNRAACSLRLSAAAAVCSTSAAFCWVV